MPANAGKKGNTVFASYHGQEINIEKNDNDSLCIMLNDKMMDLNKEIVLREKGKVLFKGKVQRRKSLINSSFSARNNADYIFSAGILVVNGKAVLM